MSASLFDNITMTKFENITMTKLDNINMTKFGNITITKFILAQCRKYNYDRGGSLGRPENEDSSQTIKLMSATTNSNAICQKNHSKFFSKISKHV